MTAIERRPADERVWWRKSVPFFLVHLAPLGLFWTGFGWHEAALVAVLYVARMFFITAGFHRYFAHRAYKTGRVMQFVLAFCASSSCQKGVLWWAAHHRAHHRYSDTALDIHSPQRGFWWSHVGWILCRKHQATDFARIKDFAQYPELVWLNRHHLLPGIALGSACAVGFLSVDDAALPRHFLDQFADAPVGQAALRDDRHESQLLLIGAGHPG